MPYKPVFRKLVRKARDDRTLGEVFFLICEELEDIAFSDALELILSSLANNLRVFLFLSSSQILTFVERFIDHLPAHI